MYGTTYLLLHLQAHALPFLTPLHPIRTTHAHRTLHDLSIDIYPRPFLHLRRGPVHGVPIRRLMHEGELLVGAIAGIARSLRDVSGASAGRKGSGLGGERARDVSRGNGGIGVRE